MTALPIIVFAVFDFEHYKTRKAAVEQGLNKEDVDKF